MLLFEKIRWRNLLSTGNTFTEIDLNRSNTTLIVGTNGAGKCVHINTVVKIRNRKTGEIFETTVGDMIAQKRQEQARKD